MRLHRGSIVFFIIAFLMGNTFQAGVSPQTKLCEESQACELQYFWPNQGDNVTKFDWKYNGEKAVSCFLQESCRIFPNYNNVTRNATITKINNSILLSLKMMVQQTITRNVTLTVTYNNTVSKTVRIFLLQTYRKLRDKSCPDKMEMFLTKINCNACLETENFNKPEIIISTSNHQQLSKDVYLFKGTGFVNSYPICMDGKAPSLSQFNYLATIKTSHSVDTCSDTANINMTIDTQNIVIENCSFVNGDQLILNCSCKLSNETDIWEKISVSYSYTYDRECTLNVSEQDLCMSLHANSFYNRSVAYVPKGDVCGEEKPHKCEHSNQCYGYYEYCEKGKVYPCFPMNVSNTELLHYCSQSSSASKISQCRYACDSRLNNQIPSNSCDCQEEYLSLIAAGVIGLIVGIIFTVLILKFKLVYTFIRGCCSRCLEIWRNNLPAYLGGQHFSTDASNNGHKQDGHDEANGSTSTDCGRSQSSSHQYHRVPDSGDSLDENMQVKLSPGNVTVTFGPSSNRTSNATLTESPSHICTTDVYVANTDRIIQCTRL